jgi:hypothetical protein
MLGKHSVTDLHPQPFSFFLKHISLFCIIVTKCLKLSNLKRQDGCLAHSFGGYGSGEGLLPGSHHAERHHSSRSSWGNEIKGPFRKPECGRGCNDLPEGSVSKRFYQLIATLRTRPPTHEPLVPKHTRTHSKQETHKSICNIV